MAANVQGRCDPRFEGVRDALAANLAEGLDVGASAAVTLDGELVADVWGGSLDPEGTAPWAEGTIVNVWSTTKTMTNLCAIVLADRGELDLHGPVERYWPEFGAAGKAGVEVRHLLAHTAGLSGWDEPMKVDDLFDWERCTSLLAAQAPWWEPGTASGYHAITQGYLVGEVVRRVTGLSVGTFFAQELAGPLGADMFIGTGPEHDADVTPVIPPPPLDAQGILDVAPDSIAMRTFTNPLLDAARSFDLDWRRAEIPAAGGQGNARGVALVQSIVACRGEVGGRRFLSAEGCDAIFEQQALGTDLVLGVPLRLGIGYGIAGPELPVAPGGRVCFWGGWGGSLVICDLDRRLCVAFVMNKMGLGTVGDERAGRIIAAAYAALDA